MRVRVKGVVLFLVAAWLLAACGSPTPAPTSPPAAQATSTTAPAAATATTAPTTAVDPTDTEPAPTEAPTNTPPAEASPTTPRETVSFDWAPGSVTPADADDVTEIMLDLRQNEGILSGTGDENGLNVAYDPTLITVEEIVALLDGMGHPVVVVE